MFSLKVIQLEFLYVFLVSSCSTFYALSSLFHSCRPTGMNWSWIGIRMVGGLFISGTTVWHNGITWWTPLRHKNRYISFICVWSLVRKAAKANNQGGNVYPSPTAQPPADSPCNIFVRQVHAYLPAPRYQTWRSMVVIYYIPLIWLVARLCNSVLALWFMDPQLLVQLSSLKP